MKNQYVKPEFNILYVSSESSINASSLILDEESINPDVEEWKDNTFPINGQGDI